MGGVGRVGVVCFLEPIYTADLMQRESPLELFAVDDAVTNAAQPSSCPLIRAHFQKAVLVV